MTLFPLQMLLVALAVPDDHRTNKAVRRAAAEYIDSTAFFDMTAPHSFNEQGCKDDSIMLTLSLS